MVKHWGAAAYRAAEAGTNALTEEERNLIIRLTGTDTPDVVEADAKEKK